jgi:beta-galactosidase GanA
MLSHIFFRQNLLSLCICGRAMLVLFLMAIAIDCEGSEIPHLRKQGTATQLIVDGEPFLMLGGELGNSSSSNLEYMKPIWSKLVNMHINTLLVPVYWELVEPEEGEFDFALVDGLIKDARSYNLRLVLLWFASWKNSMSCYAPAWVKTNQQRFSRAQKKDGSGMEILSAFSEANRDADASAFMALMRHIREVDGEQHTVIMIQVENEIGMIPEARDYSVVANELFNKLVPEELMDYLVQHKDTLIPEFRHVWEAAGFKISGTWEEVFGKGLGTEEIFTAWHYARYVNRITELGKAEYPLPMYVNAALIRPNYKPGQYPSGGPLPHLLDVWRAGAPQIDFLSPDIYFPNFAEWYQKYHRSGNPLFIPEAIRGNDSAVNFFYAIGQHDAMGFCPFSIESIKEPENERLPKSYEVLSQLAPQILKNQGKGTMTGVLLDKDKPTQKLHLGNYTLNVAHDYTWSWSPGYRESGQWPRVGGIIISVGIDEYLIAGSGLLVTFAPNTPGDPVAGIVSIDEGTYMNGRWITGRRMNGDQSHQGRHLRLPYDSFGIQRIKLYRYR